MIRDVRPRPRRRQIPVLGPQLFTGVEPVAAQFKPPTNDFFVKPKGGLWTSTYSELTGSDWIQWCLAEDFAGPTFRCWLLQPDPSTRVLEIDSHLDLVQAMDRYGRDLYEDIATLSSMALDFEAVARDYDAIHLTEPGQWATRLSQPYNLYGWDCETTLWLHWSFAGAATELGLRTWSYDRS